MQLSAHAQVNLSFEIKGRRADGFHEIETLMVPVSLADRLTIERAGADGQIHFSCDDPSLPMGEENLVVRAAMLFRERTGIGAGVTIALEKKIPHGAGLGGGSSDAASTLLGLNELFDAGLPQDELLELAARLGSDVPFFLARSPAMCRGRGELVTPVSFEASFSFLLLKPDFGVSTPWAYGKWKESRELPGIDYSAQAFDNVRFVNDLERPVFEKFVFLARLKTWLRRQPEVAAALMSGSGSTMFAVLPDAKGAEALAARARTEIDPRLWTCVTRPSFSTSPPRTRG
ncbi:MAG: 4-diphosphocytidyl-2-C-methyl-D-erythritol kinase [Verrucomicrobiota bacterium]